MSYNDLRFVTAIFLLFRRVEWIKSLHDYRHKPVQVSGASMVEIWRVKDGVK